MRTYALAITLALALVACSHDLHLIPDAAGGSADAGSGQDAPPLDAAHGPGVTIDTFPDEPTDTAATRFEFSSPDPDATFACAIDGGALAACTSPLSFVVGPITAPLTHPHTFAVTATNAKGTSIATFSWHVLVTAIDLRATAAITNTAGPVTWLASNRDDGGEMTDLTTFVPKFSGDYYICASLPLTSGTATLTVVDNASTLLAIGETSASEQVGGCAAFRVLAGHHLTINIDTGVVQATSAVDGAFNAWLSIDRLTTHTPETGSSVTSAGIGAFMIEGNVTGVTFVVPYAAAQHDDAGEFSAGTHRFTPLTKGQFLVCASLATGHTGTKLDLVKNGTIHDASLTTEERAVTGGNTTMSGCKVIALDPAASDFIDIELGVKASDDVFGSSSTLDWLTIDLLAADHDDVLVKDLTATTSLGAGAGTLVPYAVELADPSNAFTGGVFTAPVTGDYLTCASAVASTSTSGLILVAEVGDNPDVFLDISTQNPSGCHVSHRDANDTLSFFIAATSGTAATFDAGTTSDWLTIDAIH